MTSAINSAYPVEGNPTTESVRDNFESAKTEIEALQSGKQDKLISGSTIKTVAGKSVVGAGNVAITKEDVGLPNVDNTSDANKPVSTAQEGAIMTAAGSALTAANNYTDSELVAHVAADNPHEQYALAEYDGDILSGFKNKNGTPSSIGGGAAKYISVATVQATTSATPSDGTFVALNSVDCSMVEIKNYTGLNVEYQIDGSGNTVPIKSGTSRKIVGITNANQVSFRLSDYSDGPTLGVAQTRRSVVQGVAYSGGPSYSRSSISRLQIVSGGVFTAFSSAAAVAGDLLNTSGKDVQVKLNGATEFFTLKNNDSAFISGITNANQISIKPYDSVANIGLLKLELFSSSQATSTLTEWNKAEYIDASSIISTDELMNPTLNLPGSVLPIAAIRSIGKRARPKGRKILANFKTVATCNGSTSGLADVADTLERLYGTTTVEFTQSASGTYRFRGDAALSTGIDVTAHSIRARIAIPYNAGVNYSTIANSFTAIGIRIYSSGSPASPAADYHQATISRTSFTAQFNPASDLAAIIEYGLDVSKFSAVGAGATLTAITYAEIYIDSAIAGANGSKLRLFDVSAVPRVKNKATIMFAGDDLHLSQWTNFAPQMRRFGYPWMINIDTMVKIGQSTFMTIDQLTQLVQRDGCEVVYQNFRNETGVNMAPEQWIQEAGKFIAYAKALGLGDVVHGSYGSGTNTNINGERLAAASRIFKTLHLFNNGNNQNPPITIGELQPFADPLRIKRMNVGSFTATTFLQRWKDHIDQAVAQNGVAFFGFHNDFASGEALTELPNLIDYIRSLEIAGSVEVQTISQFCDQVY